jgi:hypothetical protein
LDNNIILENVDLLNARNSVHPDPFQSTLEPLVICGCGLVNCLLLPADKIKLVWHQYGEETLSEYKVRCLDIYKYM